MLIYFQEYAGKKEKYFLSEYKRLEEGYNKAINKIERNVEAEVAFQKEQVALKVKELESQYVEQLERLQRKTQYKHKC